MNMKNEELSDFRTEVEQEMKRTHYPKTVEAMVDLVGAIDHVIECLKEDENYEICCEVNGVPTVRDLSLLNVKG